MGTDCGLRSMSQDRYQSIAVAHDRWTERAWQQTIYAGGPVPGSSAETYIHGALGPGWALLVTRLARRLGRAGCSPDQMPRLVTVGAGEMHIVVPVRAPRRVHGLAAAMSRLASRHCEICLRGPVSEVSLDIRGQRETLRLCAWHGDRLTGVGASSHLREEAWHLVRHGAGALRAVLLGGRLSSAGVEAALRQYAESEPVAPGEIGWIPPDLVAHALARLSPAALAGVSVDALLPLLSDDVEEIREAAMWTLTRMRGDTKCEERGEESTPQVASISAEPAASADDVARPVGPPEPAAEPVPMPRPLPRPTYPLRAWLVTTASGSEYLVVRDADQRWWLGGRNITTLRSAPIPPGRLYEVEIPTPWPPLIGASVYLVACHRLSSFDPARLPGGGKHTSAVVAVMQVTPGQEAGDPDEGQDCSSPCPGNALPTPMAASDERCSDEPLEADEAQRAVERP